MTALCTEPIAPVIPAPQPPRNLGYSLCTTRGCPNSVQQLEGLLFLREHCAIHAGMVDFTNLLTAHPVFAASMELHNLGARLRRSGGLW